MTRSAVLAHGIGGVQDLPVPAWLFYGGSAAALGVSFVLLGLLWRTSLLDGRHGRELPRAVSRILLGPLRVAARTVSVALLVLVVVSAAVGNEDPYSNLAPTWVYVAFWLGVPAASALFGNVWSALSPWRALADATVWLMERMGRDARPLTAYPARLGRWPAAAALFGFSFLELAYADPANPRVLALAIAVYTYYALAGMAAFGRDTWEQNGEGFAVLFRLVSRLASIEISDGRMRVRRPLSGLAGAERAPGTVAVLAVMLGGVLFDGWSRSTVWQSALASVEGPYVVDRPAFAEALTTAVSAGGLIAAVIIVGGAFLAGCGAASIASGAHARWAPDLARSLVPVAVAYLVAHYLSLAAVQGQLLWPLLGDPLGRGWNLLGAASFEPNFAPLSPNTVWYAQVGALLVGHVAGLVAAHDRAFTLVADHRRVMRSQVPLLALMVLYTVGGLWVLSRG